MKNTLLVVAAMAPAPVITAFAINPRLGFGALLIFFVMLAAVGLTDDRG